MYFVCLVLLNAGGSVSAVSVAASVDRAGGSASVQSAQCDCLTQCDIDRSPDAVSSCLRIACSFFGSLSSFRGQCVDSSYRLVRRESPPASFSAEAVAVFNSSGTELPKVKSTTMGDSVPKVIHFMFKRDISKMRYLPNPVWKESLAGWRKFFPPGKWRYMFWDDDGIDAQFKRHCPGHYKMFRSFQNNISRADLARYCILHEFGGVYSDVDYEPRANFGSEFHPIKVSLIESPYKYETFQNSLMASPTGHAFWTELLGLAHEFQKLKDPTAATGPRLLDALSVVHLTDKSTTTRPDVHVLPCQHFQLKTHSDTETGKPQCGKLTSQNVGQVKGIHWGTWSWYKCGSGKVYNSEIEDLFLQLHRGEVRWVPKAHPHRKDIDIDVGLPRMQ